MKKYMYSVISLVVLWALAYSYSVFVTSDSKANPDYICVKSVTDQPCNVPVDGSTCSAWDAEGKRTCTGTMTTQVAYYLIRTSCEAWYTQVSAGWNVGWNSGRQGWDYVSQSTSCSIVQQDVIPPVWTTSSQEQ